MSLTERARAQGVHPPTAYRWFREGTLPVSAERVGPQMILVNIEGSGTSWAARTGDPVVRVEAKVGPGMNGRRSKARRLLADPHVSTVVVERSDRLGRMNVELVEAALCASGRRLLILDEGEVEDDLVGDMVEVLTSFCTHLYGRRSAKNRAVKALEAARHG